MTISMASGFPVGTSASGNTLAITTVNVGDLIVVLSLDVHHGVPVTSVTDTNSRITWQGSAVVIDDDATLDADCIVWYGTVTSVGATTVTLNGLGIATFIEFAVYELHDSNAGNSWSVVVSGSHGSASGNLTYPSLTSGSATDQAYVGIAGTGSAWGGGLTSGFTAFTIAAGGDEAIYNLALATNTLYAPTDTGGATYSTAAAIFKSAPAASSGAPVLRWPPEPPGLNPFTSITPTIVFSTGGRVAATLNQTASATVTTSGSLVRQVGAIKSATVTTTATMARQIGAIKNATVTTSASLIRQIAKTVSATVTTAGSLVRSIGKIIPTVTVTTTSTVSAIKVKLVTVTATVTTAASQVRQIGKNATATVTTSGSLQRALGKTVSAAVTTTASYVRGISKTFNANVTTSPTVVRGISKNLAVTVVTTATASETKILGGGFSSTVYAWLPFIPDEVALGQAVTLRVEFRAADGSFPALDTAPTGRVIGWGSGSDVVLAGPVAMTADGHSYYMTYTPTTKGPQSLEVRGLLAGATQFYTQGFTVRPQFDPIGLAVSDVLVSRM